MLRHKLLPCAIALAFPLVATAGAARPGIDLTASSAADAVDRAILATLGVGDRLLVGAPANARLVYVIHSRRDGDGLLELSGHALGDPNLSLTLGVRSEGVSGLVETAGGMFALGYAEGRQFSGRADARFMRDVAMPARALHSREASDAGAPVAGAVPVDIELDALVDDDEGGEVTLQLPGIGSVRAQRDGLRFGRDSTTWVGHLADFGRDYTVLFTYSGDHFEGQVVVPEGQIVLTPGSNGQLYAYNPQAMGMRNGIEHGDVCDIELAAPPHADADTSAAEPSSTGTAGVAAAAGSAAAPLDLMVYYTPSLLAKYGSLDALGTRVDALIAGANTAYSAAGLNHQLRRVALLPAAIDETASNSTVLGQMANRSGPFANLDGQRAGNGSDLATLLRPFNYAQQQSCGVAYVGGSGGSNYSAYGGYMLSVVSDGVDPGGRYYCDTLTLAHELGHNLGLMHDRGTTAAQGGGTGVKPYAFGYVPASRQWGTIMSYTTPHLYRFSNPLASDCGVGGIGESCGVAQSSASSADNVAALRYTLPLAAAFRAATVPDEEATTVYLGGVATLDGKPAQPQLKVGSIGGSDISGVRCGPVGSNGSFTCGAPVGASFTVTPSLPNPAGRIIRWSPTVYTVDKAASNGPTLVFRGSTSVVTHKVSGVVKVNGTSTAGVGFTVGNVSGASAAQIQCGSTSTSGAYSCTAPANASFTLTPRYAIPSGARITWSPASVTVSKITGSRTANFAATLTVPTYTLSGVIQVNGKPQAGATIRVSGADAGKVRCAGATPTSGKYSCTFPSRASFAISPVSTNAKFTPDTTTISGRTGNLTLNLYGKK